MLLLFADTVIRCATVINQKHVRERSRVGKEVRKVGTLRTVYGGYESAKR